jgi:hypothetical protein
MPLALVSTFYPLLDIFWTILEVVVWVIWVWVLIWVFIDIFRSHDLSGLAKALWFLFVLVIPLIGVVVYLILRGGSMHQRALERARQQEDAFRQYIRHEAPGSPPSATDQLEKLANLRDRGVITPDEFQRQKDKILAA